MIKFISGTYKTKSLLLIPTLEICRVDCADDACNFSGYSLSLRWLNFAAYVGDAKLKREL